MSYEESIRWRARAAQMRALAEEMRDGISKQVMHRIAENYERFARTVEDRPNRFLPIPPVFRAEVRRLAPCKDSVGAPPGVIDLELPSFLKRGPATAGELGVLYDNNGTWARGIRAATRLVQLATFTRRANSRRITP